MELKQCLGLALLTFCIISNVEAHKLRTDLTLEELCKELKEKAVQSTEFKVFCFHPKSFANDVAFSKTILSGVR